jgi:hypothetical protein
MRSRELKHLQKGSFRKFCQSLLLQMKLKVVRYLKISIVVVKRKKEISPRSIIAQDKTPQERTNWERYKKKWKRKRKKALKNHCSFLSPIPKLI